MKESIPLVKKAFDDEKIDEEYDGNFINFLSQMGEELEPEDGDEVLNC